MKINEFNPGERKLAKAVEKYRLTREASSILWDKELFVQTGDWKDQHRTCWCSRSLKRGDYGTGEGGFVDVYRNEARDGASIVGINRCGNIWTCPVCAGKVGEPRRAELQSGMVKHIGNGGGAYLLNFTFPHGADMPLAESLPKLDKARHDFQISREWKAFQEYAGNIRVKRKKNGKLVDVLTAGTVTSLEFTISLENGWHPHLHMLVFCKRKGFGDERYDDEKSGAILSHMIEKLQKRWVACLFKNGLGEHSKLTDMMKHALVVCGGEKAAEYIAKFGRDERWGASSEMTRGHAKIGAAGERFGIQHFTPFQLLAWIAEEATTDEDKNFRGWCIARFREYAKAVSGKCALTWSRGLKDALGGVRDLSDEELSEEKPLQILIGAINAAQFSLITRKKALPIFLAYAATCADTQADLDEYIETLKAIPDRGSGALLEKRKSGRKVVYA